jgi:hypothetical protein
LLQSRLQQATREAGQAQQLARSLQGEVAAAEQAAARAEQNVRAMTAQARQAEAVAGQAQSNLAAVRAASQAQPQETNVAPLATTARRISELAALTQTTAPAIINAQGHLTGTVVNTTA